MNDLGQHKLRGASVPDIVSRFCLSQSGREVVLGFHFGQLIFLRPYAWDLCYILQCFFFFFPTQWVTYFGIKSHPLTRICQRFISGYVTYSNMTCVPSHDHCFLFVWAKRYLRLFNPIVYHFVAIEWAIMRNNIIFVLPQIYQK